MIAVFSYLIFEASGFQDLARYFPYTIAIGALILAVIDLILQLKDYRKKSEDGEVDQLPIKSFIYIGWIIGYMLLIVSFGFISATIIFLGSFLWLETKFKLWKILISIGIVIGLLYVISTFMNIQWPTGWLF